MLAERTREGVSKPNMPSNISDIMIWKTASVKPAVTISSFSCKGEQTTR
ncbi:MAG: hypothetical protein L6416_10925 [Candidatus Omnitrophica bacterium]|nr:hypothetical protein [Candidatus Omnitrophota bacterium]